MQQIYIVNPKGGCGKTTIAVQLAGYFAQQSQQVVLVDHDAQKSSLDWVKGRSKQLPPITVIDAKSPLALSNSHIVIHDMAAAWSPESFPTMIQNGNKILVPVLPSSTDVKACIRFMMQLFRSEVMDQGVKVGLIANRVRNQTQFYSVLIAFLQQLNMPFLGSLRDTQNYVKAMMRGETLYDLPRYRVAKDLEQWQPIVDWLVANPITKTKSAVNEKALSLSDG